MKREFFAALFFIVSVSIILLASYIVDEALVSDVLHKFIVIWLLIAYYAGQYSMRFPKRF